MTIVYGFLMFSPSIKHRVRQIDAVPHFPDKPNIYFDFALLFQLLNLDQTLGTGLAEAEISLQVPEDNKNDNNSTTTSNGSALPH